MLKKILLHALFVAAFPCSPCPAQTQLDARVDSIIQAELLSKGATSASLVITRDGKTILEKQYGFADVAKQKKADAATAYRLGSTTKHITASLLLKQVERKKLSLSDSIGQYIKGLKPEWNGLTIESILNHTSGLPRDFRSMNNVGTHQPPDSLIAMAARSTAPIVTPGTKWIYSNTGYMILATLVEKLYGRPYGTVVQDEIARPLGLTTLGWCGDMESPGKVATGYMKPPNDTLSAPPYIHPSMLLAGGLCSNAADIAKWSIALHSGKVISGESYKLLTTPRGIGATANVPYAFGMYVRAAEPGGQTVFLTDGATPGYSNENVWYPGQGLSLTLLTNTSGPLSADTNLTEKIGAIVLSSK